MNKIISILSPENEKTIKYSINGREYPERLTNQAPIHFLLNEIKEGETELDLIFTVKSKSSINTIKKLSEFGYNFKIIEHSVDYNFSLQSIICCLSEIVGKINTSDKIYIDMSGGFRSASILLIAIVRMLKIYNIQAEKIVCAVLNGNTISIENNFNIYNMFDLISGLDEFVNFGSAKELINYFATSNDKQINQLIENIKKISDDLSLCKISFLSEDLNNLYKKLFNYNYTAEKEKSGIINILVEFLKESFKDLKYDNNKLELVSIIDWCLSKNMIQPAVALIIDALPDYLIGKHLFKIDNDKISYETKNEAKRTRHSVESLIILHNYTIYDFNNNKFNADIFKDCQKYLLEFRNGISHANLTCNLSYDKVLKFLKDYMFYIKAIIENKNENFEDLCKDIQYMKNVFRQTNQKEKI